MSKARIYVASSWRNWFQQDVVDLLRAVGYGVYDFRHPEPGDNGFSWSEIDPDWKTWNFSEFTEALDHPNAHAGFTTDWLALNACDACVLVLPCGASAHLELGHAIGARKYTAIYCPGGVHVEPELMYKMADFRTNDPRLLVGWLDLRTDGGAATVFR